ncbi:MAG: S-formylglutathione hydrolase [Caulobacteraceae bacterium]|nr:S-formylglutathione hydrolase [Caulobacteraceae bacterium]
MEVLAEHKVHGGTLKYIRHDSAATGTPMRFSAFVPPGKGPFPVVIWLSGLTCTEDNFTTKAGAYAAAARLGLIVVAPDTSPRGDGVANDEAYDLGQGAGFYLDATQGPWAPHFQMETYVTRDLIGLIEAELPSSGRYGISGHSMGGHGALTLGLRHPKRFESMTAFSPIASPARCPWGEKALRAYLGDDHALWEEHDATYLLANGTVEEFEFDDILIDQGAADPFLEGQLKPDLLAEAAQFIGQPLTLRMHDGYDHSYFFIASFIEDHLEWHAKRLKR